MITPQPAPQERVEAEIEARMQVLFARCPELCRFTVRNRAGLPDHIDPGTLEGEIFVFEVSLWPNYGKEQYDEVYEEIAAALHDAIEAQPEQRELLPGRSFVRAIH